MRLASLVLGAVLAFAAAPPASSQSEGKSAKVGILSSLPLSAPAMAPLRQALIEGLHERGWKAERNLVIENRFTNGRAELFPERAAELISLGVDLIVAPNSQATAAAKAKTSVIPIVMIDVSYPVEAGFVASLARPGGNVTGLTNQLGDAEGKYLELLRDILPNIDRLAILHTPSNAGSALALKEQLAAEERSGLTLVPVPFEGLQDFEAAFVQLDRERAQAVHVHPTPIISTHRAEIARRAIAHRLPVITAFRGYAQDGMLIAFGPDQTESWRRAATYIDRILRGASPTDLPVEQPVKFHLVVNLKTAEALGIQIPPFLLARADEVIE